MDLSKFKVEVYDLLAVILPGLLIICELWITLRGWSRFAQGIFAMTASVFTLLLLIAFAVGPLVQEFADVSIKKIKGKRYFKSARDHLWQSETGTHVKQRIAAELGHDVAGVDVAFDYCLTRIQGSFAKRDLFVANSDLARSLIVACSVAIGPLVRIVHDLHVQQRMELGLLAVGAAGLFFISCLCWTRMMRFRELSETPVFHAFLAQSTDGKNAAAAAK